MAIDFPSSPGVGQEFTSGGMTYVYNGTGWTIRGGSTTDFVLKAGDTMTGPLVVKDLIQITGSSQLYLDKTPPAAVQIFGRNGASYRWAMELADAAAETGSNSGSNFKLTRYTDAGTGIDSPLTVNRATGATALTGDLTITKANPTIILNRSATGQNNDIYGASAGLYRWIIRLGDGSTETGGNAGSNFVIYRWSDAGAFLDAPLSISRATGAVALSSAAASSSPTTGALTVAGGLGVSSLAWFSDAGMVIGTSVGAVPGWGNTNSGYYIANNLNVGTVIFASKASGSYPVASWNSNTTGVLHSINYQGGAVGTITTTTTTTAYNTSSDARLKEDLKSFDAGNIIDDTMVYDFKWKSTGERAFGVIAQQAAEVYDTPVFHDEKEDRWFIDYSKYVPVLLQELKALRARVAELEGKTPAVGVKPTDERSD